MQSTSVTSTRTPAAAPRIRSDIAIRWSPAVARSGGGHHGRSLHHRPSGIPRKGYRAKRDSRPSTRSGPTP